MAADIKDVVIGETIISGFEKETGEFYLLGKSLKNFSNNMNSEDSIKLLWSNFFQENMFEDNLQLALGQAREQIFHYTEEIDGALLEMSPLEAVRALMSRIPDDDDFTTALHMVAAPAVFAPAFLRMRRGRHVIRPDSTLPHSADILRMMNVSMPEPQEAQTLDTYLISVADLGLTPATFAARIAASARRSITSSIIAALSALSEGKHDSNSLGALNILDILSSEKMADDWLAAATIRDDISTEETDELISYHQDVRADIIKAALVNLETNRGIRISSKVALVESLEEKLVNFTSIGEKNNGYLSRNKVYSALLLEQLGFPSELFSCVAAMGRTIGWVAHCREQMRNPWLIRPTLRYVGSEK